MRDTTHDEDYAISWFRELYAPNAVVAIPFKTYEAYDKVEFSSVLYKKKNRMPSSNETPDALTTKRRAHAEHHATGETSFSSQGVFGLNIRFLLYFSGK